MADKANRPIEVIGHGGAGAFFTGNSRQSIEKALVIGVDRVEFDVQRSKDGDLVLVHDDEVRIDPSRKRAVRSVTTAELRERLTGLLTIDEAIELIGDRASLLIDVKSPGYQHLVAAAIERHGLGKETAISSTYANVLRDIRRTSSDVRIGISTGHLANAIPVKTARTLLSGALQMSVPSALAIAVRAIGATDVMIQHRACTSRLVKLMHARGIRVNAWTVDQPNHIRRVIGMGVDGVISNRPDLVNDALAERNR